jgi:Spy/CpxP family protein refolding chaperone
MATLLAAAAAGTVASAQSRGGPGTGRQGMPPGLGGPYELLARDDVRKELDLVDDQVKQLEGLRERFRTRVRESIAQIREQRSSEEGSPEQVRDELRKAIEQVNAEIQKEVSHILLPHQTKRLDQLALQFRMRGGLNALGADAIQELGITDEQREKLRTKSEELDREIRRKVSEMRRQAQDELLSLLTPEQQAKVRDMLGEPFEFADQGRAAAGAAPTSPPGN